MSTNDKLRAIARAPILRDPRKWTWSTECPCTCCRLQLQAHQARSQLLALLAGAHQEIHQPLCNWRYRWYCQCTYSIRHALRTSCTLLLAWYPSFAQFRSKARAPFGSTHTWSCGTFGPWSKRFACVPHESNPPTYWWVVPHHMHSLSLSLSLSLFVSLLSYRGVVAQVLLAKPFLSRRWQVCQSLA